MPKKKHYTLKTLQTSQKFLTTKLIDYVGKIISNPSSILYVAIYLEKGGRVPGRQTGGRNK